MKKRDKKNNVRSQAQIITAVLIILVVLASVIIVWQVVQRTVTKTSESIKTKQISIELDLDSAYIPEDNQAAYVALNRRSGQGKISSLTFIFTGSSYTYKYPLPQGVPSESEIRVYNITAEAVKTQNPDFTDFSTITSVSVGFEFKTESGKVVTSSVKGEIKEGLRQDKTLLDKVNTPIYEGDGEDYVEECIPETCSGLSYYCGTWDNGCGGTLSCGTCSGSLICNSTGDCNTNIPVKTNKTSISCSIDADCGESASLEYCENNLACTSTPKCINPGTTNSYCSSSENVTCEDCDHACSEGHCILLDRTILNCSDTDTIVFGQKDNIYDNGLDYTVKGTTYNSTHTFTDYCISDTQLKEYFCGTVGNKAVKNSDYNMIISRTADCNYGCSDGACFMDSSRSSEIKCHNNLDCGEVTMFNYLPGYFSPCQGNRECYWFQNPECLRSGYKSSICSSPRWSYCTPCVNGCLDGKCIDQTCDPKWVCFKGNPMYKAYLYSDCSLDLKDYTYCPNGCSDGACI